MARKPCVSVILKSHHCIEQFERAFHSVLSQGHVVLEVIVIDDDDFAIQQHLSGYRHDPRIIRLSHQRSSHQIEDAIALCAGDYIACLEPDDYWLPGSIEHRLALFELDPTVGLVFSDVHATIGGGGPFLKRQQLLAHWQSHVILQQQNGYVFDRTFISTLIKGFPYLWTSSVLVRRDLLERLPPCQDALLLGYWLLACAQGAVGYVDQGLVMWDPTYSVLSSNSPEATTYMLRCFEFLADTGALGSYESLVQEKISLYRDRLNETLYMSA